MDFFFCLIILYDQIPSDELGTYFLTTLSNLKLPSLVPLLTLYYTIFNKAKIKFCFIIAMTGLKLLINHSNYFRNSSYFFIFTVISWICINIAFIYGEISNRKNEFNHFINENVTYFDRNNYDISRYHIFTKILPWIASIISLITGFLHNHKWLQSAQLTANTIT